MKIYQAVVVDKIASQEDGYVFKYESYVAVGTKEEISDYPMSPLGNVKDTDIQYYFTEDEWNQNIQPDGKIETEEFIYQIEKRIV